MTAIRPNLLPCGGLIVPPLLWAITTQLAQILPYAECTAHVALTGIVAFAGAALSLAIGGWSWRSASPGGMPPAGTSYPTAVRFVGALSGLNALAFAFALMLQGASSLVLSGCER